MSKTQLKTNVLFLFGGKSVEHEISVISAIQAIDNMDKNLFNCIPVYITKNSVMYYGDSIADISAYKDIPALLSKSHQVSLYRTNEGVFLRRVDGKKLGDIEKTPIDVAFPVVHGLNVEDGSIQGYLHLLDIPYVGSDILSSALGMNKYTSKFVLKGHGIPVLDCVLINRPDYYMRSEMSINKIVNTLKLPVIIKPVNLGSSIGISVARTLDELKASLDLAFNFSEQIIAEPAITHLREINCSVLGDQYSCSVSECEEPLNAGDILSYQDKYLSSSGGGAKKIEGSSQSSGMASLSRRIPADIDPQTRMRIQSISRRAFIALGCSGIVRIDFLLDTDNGNIWLNEVNTIPGSLAFYLWQPMGVPYSELLKRLVDIALKRSRRESEINYSFDTNILASGKALGSKK